MYITYTFMQIDKAHTIQYNFMKKKRLNILKSPLKLTQSILNYFTILHILLNGQALEGYSCSMHSQWNIKSLSFCQGDFTRTGERKWSGLMKDGMNSANRYYLRFKGWFLLQDDDPRVLFVSSPVHEVLMVHGELL